MLANLLLITAVFYALLMFRTSKAGYLRLFYTKTHAESLRVFCRRFLVHCPNVRPGSHHALRDSASEF